MRKPHLNSVFGEGERETRLVSGQTDPTPIQWNNGNKYTNLLVNRSLYEYIETNMKFCKKQKRDQLSLLNKPAAFN